jgi:hypothetical protein
MVRRFFSALLVAGMMLVPTLPADATLIVSGSFDGGAPVFAIDNSAVSTCGAVAVGCQLPDLDPTVGILTLAPTTAGAGGGLNIQGTVQTSDRPNGGSTLNRLDSTGTQVTALSGDHTFVVAVGDTNFIGPVTQATTTGAGQWSHLGGGYGATDILMRWFNDPLNDQGAESPSDTPGLLLDTFAATPGGLGGANPQSFAHTGGPFGVNDPDLFSMTLQFSGTLAEGVRLTGREMTLVKPLAVSQPPALGLYSLGAALMGLVLVARRRR